MNCRRVGTFLFFLFVMSASHADVAYGRFVGEVLAKWNDDQRSMTLLEDFAYVDPLGVQWAAPKGSQVDGASIPQWAWSLIGGPFEGAYRKPSVVHDVACENKDRPWESVHLAFYYAMLASGVETKLAKVMYAAVYWGGPRWPMRLKVASPSPRELRMLSAQVKSSVRPGDAVSVLVTRSRFEIDVSSGAFPKSTPEEPPTSSTYYVLPEYIPDAADGPYVVDVEVLLAPPMPIEPNQWRRLRTFVEENNPSLEAIRAFQR